MKFSVAASIGIGVSIALSGCSPTDFTAPERLAGVGSGGVSVVEAPAAFTPPADVLSYARSLGYVYEGSQLIRLLSGRTAMGGMNGREGDWSEYTSHDGRAIFRNRNGRVSDGSWWVSGNQVCFDYVGTSEAYCSYAVQVDGRVQYLLTNGRMDYYVERFERGDVEDLAESALLAR